MTRHKKQPLRMTSTNLMVIEAPTEEPVTNPFAPQEEDEAEDTEEIEYEPEVPSPPAYPPPPPPDEWLSIPEIERELATIAHHLDKVCYGMYKNGLEYELGRCDMAYSAVQGSLQAVQFIMQNPPPPEQETVYEESKE